jgi:hypothetical protein
MDDQNIGVRSMTEARRLVNSLTRSLSSQRLTLNSGKTKFLKPPEVLEFFQLEANDEIDRWETRFKPIGSSNVQLARTEFESLWNRISRANYAGKGYWAKVLKRIYAAATKVDSAVLEARSLEDLIENPELDERIFQYFAKRNRVEPLLQLFSDYSGAGENLFEATEAAFFESLLLLDPSPLLARDIRQMASEFSTGRSPLQSRRPLGRASAILVMYCFGETAWNLAGLFDANAARRLPKEVARAWIAVVSALRPRLVTDVQSKLVGHPSDDVARISSFFTELLVGSINSLGNYKSQKARWPLTGKFYDMRSWLVLDIASSSRNPLLREQLRRDVKSFRLLARTSAEKRILARIEQRLRPRP